MALVGQVATVAQLVGVDAFSLITMIAEAAQFNSVKHLGKASDNSSFQEAPMVCKVVESQALMPAQSIQPSSLRQ